MKAFRRFRAPEVTPDPSLTISIGDDLEGHVPEFKALSVSNTTGSTGWRMTLRVNGDVVEVHYAGMTEQQAQAMAIRLGLLSESKGVTAS